jgi:glycosyltransferase involved in cell wall biosynthesis
MHIGIEQVARGKHPRHFPAAALAEYNRIAQNSDRLLVHEPAAGKFASMGCRPVVVSHGIERRGWELLTRGVCPDNPKPSLKSRLLYPLWRLRGCDYGLRKCAAALLSNNEDKTFAIRRYGLSDSRIFVFRNGVDLTSNVELPVAENARRILFNGTWQARKGAATLARAAEKLHSNGVRISWVLAGTGMDRAELLRNWPNGLHASTEVIPKFSGQEEAALYQRCNLFVLPSFFEGQPLALLQAMAHGRCCITTNSCGQKDILRHGVNGLLIKPGDSTALVRLIENTVADLPQQIKLGANARQTVEDRGWEAVSLEVVSYVERVFAAG